MRLSHQKQESGFTMIELMVTLTVMSILLVAATPSFIDFFDKARLRGTVDDIVSLVADARAESVKRNRDVSVAFGGAGTAWCVGASGAAEATTLGDVIPPATACLTSSSNCATATASCLIGSQQKSLNGTSYNGVVIKGAVPAAFTFDSRLGTVSPLGTTSVTLTSPRGKYDLQMTLSPLGQTTLCVPVGKPPISGISSC